MIIAQEKSVRYLGVKQNIIVFWKEKWHFINSTIKEGFPEDMVYLLVFEKSNNQTAHI